MRRHHLNETGSTLILEVIVLAVALAVAAYFAYKNVVHKTVSSASVSPKPHVVGNSSSPSPSSTPVLSTFVISQFMVHFNYSGDPSGLKYTYQTQNIEDVQFDSTKLDQAAGCTGDGGAIGILSRNPTDLGEPAADDHTNGLVTHVGGYYYYFTHPQNSCSSATAGQQEETREESVLLQDLRSLSPN